MKLDKVIVLMNLENGKKDFLLFNSQKECQKYFTKGSNLEKYQDLINYEIYYAKFAAKG